MNIYKNQGFLNIILNTNQDLSSANSVGIRYRSPGGVVGQWAGSVTDTTKVSVSLTDSSLNEVGKWTMQSYAIFSGRTAYGNEFTQNVIDL